jgi:phosphatidylglycerophosphate synthase
VSEWGKIIDPIADKILVGAVVVILVIKGLLPLWFVGMVLARDIVILVFGAYLRRRITIVPPSLMSGKLAVGAISLAGIAAMAELTVVLDISIILSAILTAVSLWQYGTRFYGIIRQI